MFPTLIQVYFRQDLHLSKGSNQGEVDTCAHVHVPIDRLIETHNHILRRI